MKFYPKALPVVLHCTGWESSPAVSAGAQISPANFWHLLAGPDHYYFSQPAKPKGWSQARWLSDSRLIEVFVTIPLMTDCAGYTV